MADHLVRRRHAIDLHGEEGLTSLDPRDATAVVMLPALGHALSPVLFTSLPQITTTFKHIKTSEGPENAKIHCQHAY
jgi:hypothetical protein